ncbi:ABC transporter substrate-binding protein [Enemella sp. A6]|uniref:ABC transporter substrate-binding protein n=1 Tax=Enemella sp. A6 TaxID=3440152 RepID=UPI003EC098FB
MRNARTLAKLMGVALAGSLLLTACGRGTPGDPTDPGESTPAGGEAASSSWSPGVYRQDEPGEPVQGGTLTFADYADGRSLDPSKHFITGFSGGTADLAIYDALVQYNADTKEFEPKLAESIEPNDDFTEWTVTLRPDTTFSDGTPLNAEAVVKSVERYIANRGMDFAVIGPHWKGVSASDDLTVVFTLSKPWATFPAMLGLGMGMIVSPTADQGEDFTPIGAGPFMLESYRPGEELLLKANPNYYGGKPYLDNLRFVWLNTDQVRSEAFAEKSVDAAFLRSPRIVKELRDGGTHGYVSLQNQGNFVQINSRAERPGSNPKVRAAVAAAINPALVYERGQGEDTVDLAGVQLFGPLSQWHVDVEPEPADTERAAKLVEEAKAEGWDGKIVLTHTTDRVGQDEAMTVVAQLEAAGMEVTSDGQRSPADQTKKVAVDHDFDFAKGGNSISEEDPFLGLYRTMHSQSFTNALGFADDEMDGLIEELRAAPGDERQDVIKRIEERFQEVHPAANIGVTAPFVPWQDNVHGIRPANEQMMDFAKAWKSE